MRTTRKTWNFLALLLVAAFPALAAPASHNDFDGDGHSDVLWRNTSTGADTLWRSGSKSASQAVAGVGNHDWQIVGQGDFNGDGRADIFWRNRSTGANTIWKSANSATTQAVSAVTDPLWKVAGIGDFNADGKSDVLWRNAATGADTIWRSASKATTQAVTGVTNPGWMIVGVGDFDGDGRSDILWRNTGSGANTIWKSANSATSLAVGRVNDQHWKIVGVGDFDGDGKSDVFWRNTGTGANVLWKSANKATQQSVPGVTNPGWQVAATGDYNGDGKSDLFWRNSDTGANTIWKSANAATTQATTAVTDQAWIVVPYEGQALDEIDVVYLASGQTPFAANCDGTAATGTLYANAEVEPSLGINPLDGNNLVGAWQQDRWSDGGARGIVSAVSLDGGSTWTRQPMPFSRCGGGNAGNGGDYARATDPWLSFSPNGVAWQMALAFTGGSFQTGSVNAMLVSRSINNGRSWGPPTTLIRDGAGFFNDKNAITADPVNAALVYAVWDRLAASGNGPTYFTRTTNAGVSWEVPRAIYNPGGINQTLGNVIVVLPDGTLVNLFTQIDTAGNGSHSSFLAVLRSGDKGVSWSPPIRVADLLAVGARDPNTGALVRDGADIAQIAAGTNGHLFVVWQDARFSSGSVDAIAISRSTDGGMTWSAPTRVNSAIGVSAFTPSVHVRSDGTVGVSYYDLRNNTADSSTLLTDSWLARSGDDGVSWRESRVSTSFDLDSAPNAGGYFLGDYQGLSSRGAVFVPFLARTTGNASNRTDVFAVPVLSATSSALALRGPTTAAAPVDMVGPVALEIPPAFRERVSANLARSLRARIPGWHETGAAVEPPR